MKTRFHAASLWFVILLILMMGIPQNGFRSFFAEEDSLSLEDLQYRIDELEEANSVLIHRLDGLENLEDQFRNFQDLSDSRHQTLAPSLQSYPLPDSMYFCEQRIPLERPDVRARFEDEWNRFLVNRHWLLSWLRRSQAAFPQVEVKLARAGIPEDLKYVMVIESAIDPRATSSAGAAGYWQFIRATGKRYGLKRNSNIDQRRDLELATDAAIAYMSKMYEEFQSWPLVLSGFNAGERRVRESIKEQGSSDFYDLVLPKETEAYWFKAAVVKWLFEHAEDYGFIVAEGDWTAVECDTLTVKVRNNRLDFRQISQWTHMSYREIKSFNPYYRKSFLPRGEHKLILPKAQAESLRVHFR